MPFYQDPHVWLVLSFVILMLAFAKFGWSRAIGMLDARINAVRHDLESAEKLRLEAMEMLASYEQRHRDAMQESADIQARARTQAEAMRVQAEKDMQDTLAKREQQLKDRLERIEQNAEEELRAATATLAVQTAEQAIRQNLDAKAQGALVDKSVSSIKGL